MDDLFCHRSTGSVVVTHAGEVPELYAPQHLARQIDLRIEEEVRQVELGADSDPVGQLLAEDLEVV